MKNKIRTKRFSKTITLAVIAVMIFQYGLPLVVGGVAVVSSPTAQAVNDVLFSDGFDPSFS